MPGTVTLNTRKIVILGSRSVGEHQFSRKDISFVENNFSEDYYPTINTTTTKTITYRGADYPCEIIDTAGEDEFSQLNSHYAIGVHGYILVYSIASRASFDMIQIIYDKIINYSGLPEIAAIIVGSKADLHMSRQVDSMAGQRLAQRNNTAWIEARALRNENVGTVFELCLAEIEKGNTAPPRRPVPSGPSAL
ncbi:small GTPase superfamily [Mycena olivaceomarginata]|nr:small GTPase superfamily [Mycena olivaceomarginata]